MDDEALRRREFLQRTALAGGLAATLATALPANTLVAEAARAQRRAELPSPRNLPIDTFVVLMMENRSFDHYLGWLPGADGHQAGLQFADAGGQTFATRRLAPDWQGCGHPDPDHSWAGGRTQPLTRRDAHAGNIGRSFDWASEPRLDPPDLPRPEHVVSMACPGAAPGGVRAKDHDVLDLVTSGYLDRMGFSYSAATPASTFREPSKVLQAHLG